MSLSTALLKGLRDGGIKVQIDSLTQRYAESVLGEEAAR